MSDPTLSATVIELAIRAAAPRLSKVECSAWAIALAAPMNAHGIISNQQVAGFIGQCAVESNGFLELDESLDYSSPGRLMAVWPSRFPTAASAMPFVHNQRGLAIHVYGGRMGNAPFPSLDGWTYRGGGLMQTTGLDSYWRFAQFKGMAVATAAAFMRTVTGAAEAACWDWHDMACGALADAWTLRALSERINGGTIGLADRITTCTRALIAIGGDNVAASELAADPISTLDPADALNAAELAQIDRAGSPDVPPAYASNQTPDTTDALNAAELAQIARV